MNSSNPPGKFAPDASTPHEAAASPPDAKPAPCIEVLVRGVCLVEAHILVCRNRSIGNRYLPGGHIDFGEAARGALEREILEELGCRSRAGRFLGACEHRFLQQGVPHAEINLLFALRIDGLAPPEPPPSREPWLAFEWQALESIPHSRLEPAMLRDTLAEWIREPVGIERFQSFSACDFANGSGGSGMGVL